MVQIRTSGGKGQDEEEQTVVPPLVSHGSTEARRSGPELMPTNVIRANKFKEQIQCVPDPGFIEQSPFPFWQPVIMRILQLALNSKAWYELPNGEHQAL